MVPEPTYSTVRRPVLITILAILAALAVVKDLIDLVGKPADLLMPNHDVQVWFGYRFAGWLAKLLTLPHLVIYGYAAYGLWRLTPWAGGWRFCICCTCRSRYSCICCCTPQVRRGRLSSLVSVSCSLPLSPSISISRDISSDIHGEVDKSFTRPFLCLVPQNPTMYCRAERQAYG